MSLKYLQGYVNLEVLVGKYNNVSHTKSLLQSFKWYSIQGA